MSMYRMSLLRKQMKFKHNYFKMFFYSYAVKNRFEIGFRFEISVTPGERTMEI